MTGDDHLPLPLLRQMHATGAHQERQPLYPIDSAESITIGRDPRCQIVIDSSLYGTVSRYHAEIRPTAAEPGVVPSWWICDLNSSNGTYVNGHRVVGCQTLHPGDRIILGQQGPEFRFEYPATQLSEPVSHRGSVHPAANLPVAAIEAPSSPNSGASLKSNAVTLTQLFPIFSTGLEITQKAYVLPALVTIAAVVTLFVTVGRPLAFNFVLANYLAFAAYFVVYRLCGKTKSWVILFGTAVLTIGILRSPILPLFTVIFRNILPGQVPAAGESIGFFSLLTRMFFGAGLMEELIKALPLILLCLIGYPRSNSWRDRFGIREPLDGILLGAASAIGFTLLETLGQYVPAIVEYTATQANGDISQLQGLHLLIPRLLGSISGHVAYSGYLGYAIGLSILKPDRAWLTLGIGYLTAAGLHALWNTLGTVNPLGLVLVGLLSYAWLGAAILKARALSPTRSNNFATRLKAPSE
ncbi:PrsW family glutamic-type intramembrane protease [Alkalinema sp. FACHB-956]|uniref:PrsW family glutamic-type intramembrane protease n=1 Tax=Alkalinema sp. FACHB-956 TaxID=2692768 RepID=UPI0016897EB6|nr:PrsW family glutamic-type intramembrane protease [Alkalinema sp. FACHB-956]MBD2328268.1 PrsW family intramembrane metalloprotease [Alkalinema sp. FACHB-956]